jgi:hypothetical protein
MLDMRRLGKYIFLALGSAALAAAGLLSGTLYRVSTARGWEQVSGPDDAWAALFPVRPVQHRAPAPAPFTGEIQIWAATTAGGSFEVAALDPPYGGGAGDQTGGRRQPLLLAADVASRLKGTLEISGPAGDFKIILPDGVVVNGRVVEGDDGRIYRLLASSRDPRAASPGGAISLFLSEFHVRGENTAAARVTSPAP